MPSLDIATVQPSLQPHLVPLRARTLVCRKALTNPCRSSEVPKRVSFYHVRSGNLVIAAVATLEKCSVQKNNEQKNPKLFFNSSPSKQPNETIHEESEQVDERERLRRMRISKANKGNTPWNKGRKHSPETLQKIREKTKLAMQNPKIRMKLASLGHAQSEQTKLKIGVGVRMGWERRRGKQMLQETCHFEWQNLIAEAARRGCSGEEEQQWDSYRILDEQLTQEWFVSVEQRKTMRPKGSKRAPKSAEQRKKIAEAIAAKWADPAYRERVCSGLAKYHGTPVGRKPRRKPSATTGSTKKSLMKSIASSTRRSFKDETADSIRGIRLQRRNMPVYKDPLASSKLEMIKVIRAQRAAAESKKLEAIEHARLLIIEAKKAAKALEVAATKSPVAQASLTESRKLIAEASRVLEAIGLGQKPKENGTYPSSELEKDRNFESEEARVEESTVEVNGTCNFFPSGDGDLDYDNLTLQGNANKEREVLSPKFKLNGSGSRSFCAEELNQVKPNGSVTRSPELNGINIHSLEHMGSPKYSNNYRLNRAILQVTETEEKEETSKPVSVTKKWVRGRLVEVTEGA